MRASRPSVEGGASSGGPPSRPPSLPRFPPALLVLAAVRDIEKRVLCAVDVHYEPDRARASCTVFAEWTSAASDAERVIETPPAEPYVPGQFFRRELPPLLAVLGTLPALPDIVIVDGYVWLDADRTPGLGARVHEALGIAVVGVAKTPYRGAVPAARILRGGSAKPLLVSAIGLGLEDAADGVRRMHGAHRVPVLLKRTDQLARGLVQPLGGR